MKRFGRYVCDHCHKELDPRAVFAVTIDRIQPNGIYSLQSEYHFCPDCLRLAQARIEQSTEVF